jgi:hypothetical protein
MSRDSRKFRKDICYSFGNPKVPSSYIEMRSMAEVYERIDAMSSGCIPDRIINIGSQATLWRGPSCQNGCDGNAVDRL